MNDLKRGRFIPLHTEPAALPVYPILNVEVRDLRPVPPEKNRKQRRREAALKRKAKT